MTEEIKQLPVRQRSEISAKERIPSLEKVNKAKMKEKKPLTFREKAQKFVAFKGRRIYSPRELADKAYYPKGTKFNKQSSKLTPREKYMLKLKYGLLSPMERKRQQSYLFTPTPLQQNQEKWNNFHNAQREQMRRGNVNMFAKDFSAPTPFEGAMDLLFGWEGQKIIQDTTAIFPSLDSGDAGNLVNDVAQEMGLFSNNPPPKRFVRRRRR